MQKLNPTHLFPVGGLLYVLQKETAPMQLVATGARVEDLEDFGAATEGGRYEFLLFHDVIIALVFTVRLF